MKKTIFLISIILLTQINVLHAQRIMENLNRGLVAVRTSPTQVFLSWRLQGSDPDYIAFNLYRDGVKITDNPLTGATNFTDQSVSGSSYTVKPVLFGIETGESNSASVWNKNYIEIPMNIPAEMTMPDGTTCTYHPSDCSTGDVDNDGEFEIVVKWDPSNAKDNSQSGYTGNVIFDVYKLTGRQMCRIDLGKNIRAGSHYTQFQVADYDGDGKAEIACKTAPGTKDGTGNYISKGPAATASHTTDYRNSGGYILTGPEYFTVFSGETGAELATANYNPARGTVSSWGDSYGNRVDRFLAGTAWLDGVLPSMIMCRGYYTRAVVAAWNYRNGTLTNVWTYDSGTTSGSGLYGQGNHNLSIGDVDNDGKDEIIWGAGAVDHDGKLMYRTGLGHGDAMHLSDLDPDRKGLEVWEVHESTGAAYGEEMHDARTGAILWGTYTGTDNGRGVAANVIPGNRTFEMWSASGPGVMSKTGLTLNSSKPSMNFRIYWDGDAEDELLDNTSITKYGVGTLFTAEGCSSNNSTKSTPCLSADILGDWREEVIYRTEDDSKLRVFTTTNPTSYRIYTLMHDAVYRAGITWENTAYNQPPHLGYYMGDDMDTPPVSPVYAGEKRWKSAATWDAGTTSGWTDSQNQTSSFQQGDGVLFDLTAAANATINITEQISPKSVKLNSPFNVEISGTGSLTGNMELKKIGTGILKLNNINSYTGNTTIWDGEFYNNGTLTSSEVFIKAFVKAGGSGIYGKQLNMGHLSTLEVGNTSGQIAKLTLMKSLKETGTVNYNFDVIVGGGKVTAHDTLLINENWFLGGKATINLNVQSGTLMAGSYVLIQCKGAVTGDLTQVKIKGVPTYLSYNLLNINGNITLVVSPPAILTWKGNVDSKWDNGKTGNWILIDETRTFSSNDSVLFNDETTARTVQINESVSPSTVKVQTDGNYTFAGTGSIDGNGTLVKSGSGKLLISTANKYSGKTIISEGTLEIGSLSNGGVASPIGAATKASANILLDGGRLSYTGATVTTDRGITFGQNGGILSVANSSSVLTSSGQFTGKGRLIKEGPGRISVAIANNYSGGTTIKAGTIGLTTDVANTSGLGTSDTITFMGGSLVMFESSTTDNTSTWNLKVPQGYSGTLNVDSRSVIGGTITGSGTLNYYTSGLLNVLTSDASQFTGIINVTSDADGGNFMIYNTKGYERAKINLNNNVTMMYRVNASLTIPIGELSGTSKAILGAGGTGVSNINWEIGARNTNSTFNGVISNAQYSGTGAYCSVSKVGTGILTLTNANTYTGGTKVMSGEMMINNISGSGTGTGNVQVYTDARLSGNGIIDGKLIIDEGGELAPGNGIGTLTVNNQVDVPSLAFLSFDIDKPGNKSDVLSCTGTLNLNGKLQLNPTPETIFANGDAFKIINGTITGMPEEIIPAIPGEGLEWDLSELISAGTLKVKTATGIAKLSLQSEIYPNPVADILHIKLRDAADKIQLSVFNLTGSQVLAEVYNQTDEIEVNVSALKSGIYFINLKTGLKNYAAKVVKK